MIYGGAKSVAGVDFCGFGQASSGQDGRPGEGPCDGLRRRGVGAIRREVFCLWRPLEVVKPWQTRTFATAELAPSMTLKCYWVPKP